jgi:hypothetical protein
MSKTPGRRLIWVPIVHSQADHGNMSERIRSLYIRRMGKARWEQHVTAIEEMWGDVWARVGELGLDYFHVRLYQDGLPVCGKEEQIVRDLAQAGSRNHQLLVDLMAKGASLIGTEAASLLLQEYELARQVLAAADSPEGRQAAPHRESLADDLLERRDRAIAERIDRTLAPGETGLVFLGLLHAIGRFLPPDIRVERLDERRRSRRSKTAPGRRAGER